ncbi:hypothetical protein KEM48_001682 [Puccinia striiformis f. sp. tritici PST-130]|nr:hypothetical protein H4Q26_000904 [Puccinia striiformis f. sp. tritici PST-130]KAI9606991.1 hypothetical protein KEM48_001682 [Puccinia striiformis f. sp. tritici PST-130]
MGWHVWPRVPQNFIAINQGYVVTSPVHVAEDALDAMYVCSGESYKNLFIASRLQASPSAMAFAEYK